MALLPRKGKIAVLELFGVIGNTIRPSRYVPLLEEVRKSRRMRGLVLDVDSPGGAAAASAELHAAVKRVAEEKPVVAYIRGTGASGAYYLSCAAHRIVAMPDALVGSIGVIAMRPILTELLQRIGVGTAVYKSGRLKDMFQPWRAPTPEEEEKVQALLDDVYGGFIGAVAQGRGLEEERVRELATGEVFTGRQAQPLGLVDQLGDMNAALEVASEMGRVPRRVQTLRLRRPFLRRLFGGIAEEFAQTLAEEVELRLQGRVLM